MDAFLSQGYTVRRVSCGCIFWESILVASRSTKGVPILVNLFNSSMLRFVKPGASRRDEARIVSSR